MTKRKKPYKKDKTKDKCSYSISFEKKITYGDLINMVMAFFALLSLICTVCTLREMQKDRETAYMPSILMNPTEYSFSWDENGHETWYDLEKGTVETDYGDDGTINVSSNIPIKLFADSHLETFSIVNAGVGTARDISLTWEKGNTQRLFEYLVEQNPEKERFCQIGKNVSFEYDEGLVITGLETDSFLLYALPNASEAYTIALPTQYTILIHEIIKCNKYGDDLPNMFLHISYSDISGNKNDFLINIYIKKLLFEENTTGEGCATYQLIPLFPAD